MAPRGRPAKGIDPVAILNGDVEPSGTLAPALRKRKVPNTTKDGSPAKRRATKNLVEQAQEIPEPMASRLRHPRLSADQKQTSTTSKQRDLYEPPTSPEGPKNNKKTMKLSAKPRPVLDPDNSAFEGGEGEEDATNPLMRSPAQSTRSHDKKHKEQLQARDGEEITVHVEPVKRVGRPQRRIGQRAAVNGHHLHEIHTVPGEESVTPIPPGTPQELGNLPSIVARSLDKQVNGHDPATDDQGQARAPTADEEEPVESVESQSGPARLDEAEQTSDEDPVFEEASTSFECKVKWDEMSKAARQNGEIARAVKAPLIQRVVSHIKEAEQDYERIRTAKKTDRDEIEFDLANSLQNLTLELQRIRPSGKPKQDKPLIRDIYYQAIPKLVSLLKVILITRYKEESLSKEGLKELKTIMDVSSKVCFTAAGWHPRPSNLDTGVRERTRRVIKPCLDAIRKVYTKAEWSMTLAERKRTKPDWKAVVAKQNVDWLAAQQQKQELAICNVGHHRRSRTDERPNAQVFDVNDLDPGVASPKLTQATRSTPGRGTGVVAARKSLLAGESMNGRSREPSRMSRERTEDIPGPMARAWSDAEDIALLDGLERFTSADRFMEIVKAYGSGDGPLSSRDMDELMQRAAFYKQSMASHFEAEKEETGSTERWAWLLSVDG